MKTAKQSRAACIIFSIIFLCLTVFAWAMRDFMSLVLFGIIALYFAEVRSG